MYVCMSIVQAGNMTVNFIRPIEFQRFQGKLKVYNIIELL